MKQLAPLAMMAVVFLHAAPASAQDVDQRIAETLSAHAWPMTVDDDGISGSGAERLVELGRDASFFALGESHLNNETPVLTTALLEALQPSGYTALAIETGVAIADHAQAELRAGRVETVPALFAEVPFTAAFIDHEAEFTLLERAVALGYDLWGLDQVFAGGARFNLARLVELAPNDTARAAATAGLERARRGFQQFARSGDTSVGFLQSATPEDYAALREAFADAREEARRIVDELAASSRIYQLFGRGANYQSNHERIRLMKRHLADRVNAADAETRVFLKFGSVHMGRGYSPLNQLDLGNAAAEIGLLRGGGSLHVKVTALASTGTDGAVSDWTASSPYLKLFANAMSDETAWTVFDLRPLRPIFHRAANAEGREELSELVWAYDLLVVARGFTRAEPLPGVPVPPGQ